MNRRLVLSSEGAGHPFRRTLPPHVLRMPQPEPEVAAAMARAEALDEAEAPLFRWETGIPELAVPACELSLIEPAPVQEPARRWFDRRDLQHFAMAYCACLLAALLFIS